MPSDYRFNPFNDVSTAVTCIERHLIPSSSPYYIRTREVPQKNSPSTTAIKFITAVSGETVTYGTTLSEVAATPAAGEFLPDYQTGANDDDTWNTGLIEFNAADAGKFVEITYTGTGALASVKVERLPAWYYERGDGSDGHFAPTADCTISGVKNYNSVYIPSGITVTVSPYAVIKCRGAFVNAGTLTATGQGAAKVQVPTLVNWAYYSSEIDYSGVVMCLPTAQIVNIISAGGASAVEGRLSQNNLPFSDMYGNTVQTEVSADKAITADVQAALFERGAICYGGHGGGYFSNTSASWKVDTKGGGAILIAAKSVKNTGTISAGGKSGYRNSGGCSHGGVPGGGGGGTVFIAADTVANTGTISATKGLGSQAKKDWGSDTLTAADGADGFVRTLELGVV